MKNKPCRDVAWLAIVDALYLFATKIIGNATFMLSLTSIFKIHLL